MSWTIQIPPLADVAPAGLPMEDLPTGAYAVDCAEVGAPTEAKNGKGQNVLFTCTVVEGEHAGAMVRVNVNTAWDGTFQKKHVKALMMSLPEVKANPTILASSQNIGPHLFVGKRFHVYVKAPPPGELDAQGRKPFANTNFITPEAFTTWKSSQAKTGAAAVGVQTLGGPVTSAFPSLLGGPPSNGLTGAAIPHPIG